MAEYILGFLYYAGDGVPADVDEAVSWFRLAAEHGNVEALKSIGDLFVREEWQPSDDAAFRNWYREVLASYRGIENDLDPDSMYALGAIYVRGGLIEQDPREAQFWFEMSLEQYRPAAESGDRHARCMLGYMYGLGQGTPPNAEESERWLSLAAQEGSMFACVQEAFSIVQTAP